MFLTTSQIVLLAAYLMSGVYSHPCSPQSNNAIFFLTNDQMNSVVAIPIGDGGMLSGGSVTATGGAGSNSIDGATNKAAAPDPLIGQSALTVAGQVILLLKLDVHVTHSITECIRRQRWQQHLIDVGH